MNEHLIGHIQEARFTPTRQREGYDMGQVDYYLDQVCEIATEREPDAARGPDPITRSVESAITTAEPRAVRLVRRLFRSRQS